MMTKDEIKKGLEFCKADWCAMCPYCNCIGCAGFLKQDALNLITEQEKEIERLKAENNVWSIQINQAYDNGYKDGYDSAQDDIEQAKIDVLNELWEKVKDEGVDYKIGMRALSEEIDELIKE